MILVKNKIIKIKCFNIYQTIYLILRNVYNYLLILILLRNK